MKIIISNFIEHFYEWKNKIENQRNPYLTQIFNDIKHVLENPNASHNNKAATLVNIIQNIPFEYIPFLFDYSTAELKIINGDGTLLKDEAISVSLYNDFIGDLSNSEYLDSESENIEFNNEIINPELLTFILTESINLHACGMNIVNKLYDLNNDEVDEQFAISYPWNESFDDEINYIWYHTYQIIKTLDKSNELNSIIDIDKINAESNTNENNYKSKNLNILLAEFFNQMMFIQESLINKGKYNINEWESIYRNINLKELLERLIFSYASDDNVIIKYFHVQEKIDYSQFKSEE